MLISAFFECFTDFLIEAGELDTADRCYFVKKGIKIGLVTSDRKLKFEDKFAKMSEISLQMSSLTISPTKAEKNGIKIALIKSYY